MTYTPEKSRYQTMRYNRCGKSGVCLPAISLGLWHNFAEAAQEENCRAMLRRAFDLGINHFDLANNYGPPPGAAESMLGGILRKDFGALRDELLISSKAGYTMWPGPYGDWGSKKYLVSSLDQSLKRLKLDYVDIFYHHRPDPQTPLEETMGALDLLVRQGKALYVGLSNYKPDEAKRAIRILRQLGTPCLIHQAKYSLLERWPEDGLLDLLEEQGVGCIAFSPLGKGVLTDRYLDGIPEDSRAAGKSVFLQTGDITPQLLAKVRALSALAKERGQNMAQLALAWVLRGGRVSSVLIGASKPEQITDCVAALGNLSFDEAELQSIENILK